MFLVSFVSKITVEDNVKKHSFGCIRERCATYYYNSVFFSFFFCREQLNLKRKVLRMVFSRLFYCLRRGGGVSDLRTRRERGWLAPFAQADVPGTCVILPLKFKEKRKKKNV